MKQLFQTRRVLVAILALGLFALSARTAVDPDLWWHLRTGQWIFETHSIPRADPFSFTRAGQPWMNHEWLSDVLMFDLYRMAGWAGLIVMFSIITALAFFILFVRSPGKPYLAAFIVIWGVLASGINLGVRPQMISLLLASIFLFILDRSRNSPWLLWLLPGLTIAWVNLHAAYAIGITFVILFLFGELLDLAFGFESWRNTQPYVQRLFVICIACLAVIPLNPYGIRMYAYPLETLSSQGMQSHIQEWFPPNFHDLSYLPLLLMVLGLCVALAFSRKRLRPREFLLLAFTLAAALHSIRHIPIFVLIAVPILSGLAQGFHTADTGIFHESSRSISVGKMTFNLLILLGFGLFTFRRAAIVIGQQQLREAEIFPTAAIHFIRGQMPPGPILSSYDWGGYFLWKLYPQYRVFIDGRADVYGDKFMTEYGNVYEIRDDWREVLEQWHIQTVLLPPKAPLAVALRLDGHWKPLYADSASIVLTKVK